MLLAKSIISSEPTEGESSLITRIIPGLLTMPLFSGFWVLLLVPLVSSRYFVPRHLGISDTLAIRREWFVRLFLQFGKSELTGSRGELLPSERIDYTNAVLCLQRQPAHLPNEEFPGVRSRFDDFVAFVYDQKIGILRN